MSRPQRTRGDRVDTFLLVAGFAVLALAVLAAMASCGLVRP